MAIDDYPNIFTAMANQNSLMGAAGTGVCFPAAHTITTTGVAYPNQMIYGPGGLQATQTYPMPTTNPYMNRQLLLVVAPVANGFIVGIQGQDTDKLHYCKDYIEISQAIVAILALNKLIEKE